ncbi:MAG: endolytic transglycosylase MltG [Desulfovibrionaceae bacterium]|nr:endolytic transglycosylase MltG [Desulfovibrionaceae bacterium]
MWKIIRTLLLLLLAAAVCTGGWLAHEAHTFLTSAPEAAPGREVYVDVPPGAALSRIASQLQKQGIITDARKFRLLARYRKIDTGMQAGRFLFSTSWVPDKVLETLAFGKPVLTRVTIPEGLTWWQTARILADSGFAPYEDLAGVMRDPAFLRHYGIPFDSAEGFLMPDTYLLKTPGEETRKDPKQAWKVCGRLVDNFWQKADALWKDGKRPGRDDLRKAVILASIVEKETAIPEERPRVAGVYSNRMRIGMLLQADPTVIYGLGPNFKGNLTRAMLNNDSNAYNTYRKAGLPPGPICSFGSAALKAALYPEKHNYLYFVAVTDGGAHSFSRTLSEHNAAVRRYLNNRRQQRAQ